MKHLLSMNKRKKSLNNIFAKFCDLFHRKFLCLLFRVFEASSIFQRNVLFRTHSECTENSFTPKSLAFAMKCFGPKAAGSCCGNSRINSFQVTSLEFLTPRLASRSIVAFGHLLFSKAKWQSFMTTFRWNVLRFFTVVLSRSYPCSCLIWRFKFLIARAPPKTSPNKLCCLVCTINFAFVVFPTYK